MSVSKRLLDGVARLERQPHKVAAALRGAGRAAPGTDGVLLRSTLEDVAKHAGAVAREDGQMLLRKLEGLGVRDHAAQHALIARMVSVAAADGKPRPGHAAETVRLAAQAGLKLGAQPTAARPGHSTVLSMFTRAVLKAVTPSQATKAVTALAKLAALPRAPPGLADALVAAALEKGAAPIAVEDRVLTYWGCAKHGVRGAAAERLEGVLVNAVLQGEVAFQGRDMARFAWGYAKRRPRRNAADARAAEGDVVAAVLGKARALSLAGSLGPLDIAHVLWGAARLRTAAAAHEAEVAALMNALATFVPSSSTASRAKHATNLSPQSITMALWAATSMQCYNAAAATALGAAAAGMAGRMDAAGAAMVLWALQRHDVPLGYALAPLVRQCTAEVTRLKGREIMAVVSSAAGVKSAALRSGAAHRMLHALVAQFAASAAAVADVHRNAIPLFCQGALALGLRTEGLLDPLLADCVRRADLLDLEALTTLQWCLVKYYGAAAAEPVAAIGPAVADRLDAARRAYAVGDRAPPARGGPDAADPTVGASQEGGGDGGHALLPSAARVLWACASARVEAGRAVDAASAAASAYATHFDDTQFVANAMWGMAVLRRLEPSMADACMGLVAGHKGKIEARQVAACMDALLAVRYTPPRHTDAVAAAAAALDPVDIPASVAVGLMTSFGVARRCPSGIADHLLSSVHCADLNATQVATVLWACHAVRCRPAHEHAAPLRLRAAALIRTAGFTESEAAAAQGALRWLRTA
eukprot:TRINITY_DN30439_c0_g1_i1.p1 TRINITY_DN30439_c0_g1~~TRINITY_DN30439_c0_g1_i1.p1  ORF type:complete len:759 (+),score=146.61 TRINITY_DN30439_c0_g1_i1:82-2358(+)